MVAAHSVEGATVETLSWLLENGADLHAVSEGGVTAAWYAAGNADECLSWHLTPEHVERLRYLLDAGLDYNETCLYGRSLLVEASAVGDAAKVKLLLERGASPYPSSLPAPEKGEEEDAPPLFLGFQIPLFCAAASGSAECVRLLLAAGVDSNSQDFLGETALANARSVDVVHALLDAGAHINFPGDEDILDIVFGYESEVSDKLPIAQVSVDAGIPIERASVDSWSRLELAAFRRQAGVVDWLITQGAFAILSRVMYTPLHAVCWKGDSFNGTETAAVDHIIRTFVTAGIPVNTQDKKGQTPLHFAVDGDWENPDAARTLLELGANPNIADIYGQTPFHIAAKSHRQECWEVLLAANADPRLIDREGHTAVWYQQQYDKIRQRLKEQNSATES